MQVLGANTSGHCGDLQRGREDGDGGVGVGSGGGGHGVRRAGHGHPGQQDSPAPALCSGAADLLSRADLSGPGFSKIQSLQLFFVEREGKKT